MLNGLCFRLCLGFSGGGKEIIQSIFKQQQIGWLRKTAKKKRLK